MNQSLFIQSLTGLLFFIACIGLVIIVAASVYDIQAITKRRRLQTTIAKLRKSRQPHITVLVYAKGNIATIEACLESIRRSRYQNYDCVVVDNVSCDTTKQVAKLYGQKYPKFPLRVYAKRKVGDQHDALRQAYQKSRQGSIVCVFDAASIIGPTVLKGCAARFIIDDRLQALQFNARNNDDLDGVVALSTRFLQLSRHNYVKLLSILSLGRLERGLSGTVYRAVVFTEKNINKKIPYRYDGSLVISTQPVRNTTIVLAMTIFALLLVTYSVYLATSLQSGSLLVLSWLVLVIWLLLIVWSDEASRIREKIILTFCVPAFYFLLYAQLMVQGIAGVARVIGLTSKFLPK